MGVILIGVPVMLVFATFTVARNFGWAAVAERAIKAGGVRHLHGGA